MGLPVRRRPSLWWLGSAPGTASQRQPATEGLDCSRNARQSREFHSPFAHRRSRSRIFDIRACASFLHSLAAFIASSSLTGSRNAVSLNRFQPSSVSVSAQCALHRAAVRWFCLRTTRYTALKRFSGSERSICSASIPANLSSCFWHDHFPALNRLIGTGWSSGYCSVHMSNDSMSLFARILLSASAIRFKCLFAMACR